MSCNHAHAAVVGLRSLAFPHLAVAALRSSGLPCIAPNASPSGVLPLTRAHPPVPATAQPRPPIPLYYPSIPRPTSSSSRDLVCKCGRWKTRRKEAAASSSRNPSCCLLLLGCSPRPRRCRSWTGRRCSSRACRGRCTMLGRCRRSSRRWQGLVVVAAVQQGMATGRRKLGRRAAAGRRGIRRRRRRRR